MAEHRGLRAHLARVRRIAGPGLRDAVGAAVQQGAQALAAAAREAAGEGSLAEGIIVVPTGTASVEVRSTAPHAAIMEFGTAKTPGRPHLRPAAARLRDALPCDVAAAVRDVVRGG